VFDLGLVLCLQALLLLALARLLLLAQTPRERRLEGAVADREILSHRGVMHGMDIALPVGAHEASPVGSPPAAIMLLKPCCFARVHGS